uniref:Uncharacterized protein n=1 Tax=Panagrolaimus sp. ES5 TaxID=591445 RepID=A0AC34FSX9_9BILA
MKSIIVILLFTAFMVLICEESEFKGLLLDERWKTCLNGRNFDNTSFISFAYFSEHGYQQFKNRYSILLYTSYNNIPSESEKKRILLPFEDRFLSLCLCRSNHNAQHFFISPYFLSTKDTEAVEFYDAIILCLIGHENFESIGIYDDEELFDILLMKKNEAVPNSVINPFGVEEYKDNDEPACYDFNGFPTKNVLGQRTCLLAAEFSHKKNYIYSGPLMGKAMIIDSMQYCYTLVNDSMRPKNVEDYCSTSISSESVKLQCCCAHSPHLCSPKGLTNGNKAEHLYCLTGHMNNTVDTFTYSIDVERQMTLEQYVRYAVNSFCATMISISTGGNVAEDINNYDLYVHYSALTKCVNETSYELNDKKFCSFDPKFPNAIEITKCCKDGHFCNQKFIPKNIQPLKVS